MRFIFLFLFLLALSLSPAGAQSIMDGFRRAPETQAQVELSFAPLVKKVAPAVVSISTKRVVTQRVSPFMRDPFFEHFFGRSFGYGGRGLERQRVESALGSGVIVDPGGLVVTNAHVIKDADEVTVILADGREFLAEKALTDEPSDLALLRITPEEGQVLPHVTLKPSEMLEVGDLVLAIGNPFGVGQTVTSGIISAQARAALNVNDFNFFIQTDAAINPGNSGGPLVAMDGQVVGINTAIFSKSGGSLGIGFAVPSEMVESVIAAEKAGLTSARGVIRPWLGITAQEVTADIAESLGLDKPQGVLIAGLHPASPAKKVGLKTGDVVLSVNGRVISAPEEMKFRMATVPLSQTARFEILRAGQKRTLQIEAMAPPENPARDETLLEGVHPLTGVTVVNINPAVAVELGLDEEEGVVVLDVASRAAARLVVPGDLILGVNGREIEDVGDLRRTLKRGGNQRDWVLTFSRNGRPRRVSVR